MKLEERRRSCADHSIGTNSPGSQTPPTTSWSMIDPVSTLAHLAHLVHLARAAARLSGSRLRWCSPHDTLSLPGTNTSGEGVLVGVGGERSDPLTCTPYVRDGRSSFLPSFLPPRRRVLSTKQNRFLSRTRRDVDIIHTVLLSLGRTSAFHVLPSPRFVALNSRSNDRFQFVSAAQWPRPHERHRAIKSSWERLRTSQRAKTPR